MIRLEKLRKDHWPALYEIVLGCEPFAKELVPTFSHFKAAIAGQEGFALLDEDTLAGAATFSNFFPLIDICLNVAIDPQYRSRWASRGLLRRLCEYVFMDLDLPRMSSYAVKDVTPHVARVLFRAGFQIEGVKKNAARFPDGHHDLLLFGMLREDCRWL